MINTELSDIENEAIKLHSLLQNNIVDHRSLHQVVIQSLLAVGVEEPSLIEPSVKILCSSRYVGSLNVGVARITAFGLRTLFQSIPEIQRVIKEEEDYLTKLVEARGKIQDEYWKEYTVALQNLLRSSGNPLGKVSPRKKFFPPGTQFDVYNEVRKMLIAAVKEVTIIDPYFDLDAVSLLGNIPSGVSIRVLAIDQANKKRADLKLGAKKYNQQYGHLELRLEARPGTQHSRFIVVDDTINELTASLNQAGTKNASIIPWTELAQKKEIISNFEAAWNSATIVT